jgi:hypothetical protein
VRGMFGYVKYSPYLCLILITTLNFKTMQYQIKRECWNEKTFNGYVDNPYWKIELKGLGFVLNDDGRVWSSDGIKMTEFYLDDIRTIIKECKLNIDIISPL